MADRRKFNISLEQEGCPAITMTIEEVKNHAGSTGEYKAYLDGDPDNAVEFESFPEYPWQILSAALDQMDAEGLI